MPTSATRKTRPKFPTIADVQERLGHIPEARILAFPSPGTATIQDMLDDTVTNGHLCELVDGILVEKTMGFREGAIAVTISFLIRTFLDSHNLGLVAGADSGIRFKLNLVRMPDVSFIRWDSVDDPDEIENPPSAFLEYPPDLAIEVLSAGNTRREMEIKLEEYAKAGVKLVWYVDPEREEVGVYPKANAKRKKTVGIGGMLEGGDILPGFTLPVARIFEKRAPTKKGAKKGKK